MQAFVEPVGDFNAVMVFKRKFLIYDIENLSYIEGDLLGREKYETARVVQDVAQRGNIDRVNRIVDLAVAACREALYPFTKQEFYRPVVEDDPDLEHEYEIHLALPGGFSQTTLDFLEKLIHEFIVATAMSDWMSITNPAKKEIWEAKAGELKNKINTNLRYRTTRTRRRLHPF